MIFPFLILKPRTSANYHQIITKLNKKREILVEINHNLWNYHKSAGLLKIHP